MTLLRSLLFNLLFWAWTGITVIGYAPALLGPPRWAMAAQRNWAYGTMALARIILGIRYEERGRQNLPAGPVILAVKHQSTFETVVFNYLVPDPAIVLKKELLSIPLYGSYARRMGMIPIDRRGTAAAMRHMLRVAEKVARAGRPIVIFPEGTRVPAGTTGEYRAGVVGLYRHLNIPVVPVALNSGLYWPRRTVVKRPGTVLIEYLPPIAPGLDRRAFIAELKSRIEPATARLLVEAGFQPVDKPEHNPGENGD